MKNTSPLVAYPISSLLSLKENADLYSWWQCATQLHINVYFPAIYQEPDIVAKQNLNTVPKNSRNKEFQFHKNYYRIYTYKKTSSTHLMSIISVLTPKKDNIGQNIYYSQ